MKFSSSFAEPVLLATALCVTAGCKSLEPPPVSPALDLAILYPEIEADRDFQDWSAENPVVAWNEGPKLGTGRTVIVQGGEGEKYYAAHIDHRATDDRAVAAVYQFDAGGAGLGMEYVEGLVGSHWPTDAGTVRAISPNVDFWGANAEFYWQIEFMPREGNVLELWRVDLDRRLERVKPDIRDEDCKLDSNGLFHKRAVEQEARSWTTGLTSTRDKAERVMHMVKDTFTYNSSLPNIELTWADDLILRCAGKRGMCDEFAVAAVSYLRALGIEARLVFLAYRLRKHWTWHAAVEFKDGNRWRHMDPLYRKFDEPGYYRQLGAEKVTVMIASDPDDTRTTKNPWKIHDPSGDGMLYPWGDLVLSPSYPGKRRAGYSK